MTYYIHHPGSFQYLHNLKKEVKIEETFKVFVTSDRLALELHKQNYVHVKIHDLINLLDLHKFSGFYFFQFQLKLVKNCGSMAINLR